MAQIVINEISQNYTYNIGTNSYATVAMPITACWGPGYFDPEKYFDPESGSHGHDDDLGDLMLDQTAWTRFPATQRGLESFVSTYRGPSSLYRSAKDYSYQMAMTLLTAGYDVLVCRLCPGIVAEATMEIKGTTEDPGQEPSVLGSITFKAKYPGTFGNNLRVSIRKRSYATRKLVDGVSQIVYNYYYNMVTYVVDATGVKTALENQVFVVNPEDATDNILYWKELELQYVRIVNIDGLQDNRDPIDITSADCELTGGTDYNPKSSTSSESPADLLNDAYNLAKSRYDLTTSADGEITVSNGYLSTLLDLSNLLDIDLYDAQVLRYREWLYTQLVATKSEDAPEALSSGVFDLLKDKLSYNPNRIITSGWDDQDLCTLLDDDAELHPTTEFVVSPLHVKLLDVAYHSRCATGYIDIPRSLSRAGVYTTDDFSELSQFGYAQKLARFTPKDIDLDINGSLYQTHCGLFAPWGRYMYVGTGKQNTACPSFLTLMIQRAQILNQAAQYEWALPTNRKHNLRIGKLAYNVPKKLLDIWQTLEGIGVNVITAIPDLGVNLWGNSTLFEVPPATYQALANLSTRLLVNAVEDVAYRVGVSITFQYNNDQAYNKFYAGVTPILDTMRNIGAIDDYYVKMAADINGLDQVNANTVIGKIYLVVNGVINDIYIDLIALPPGTDLNQYRV